MRKKPADGLTHWSCRKLAAALHISKDAVHRVWKEAGMQTHRLERYMASSDPDLETKAADSIGLYLHPGRHAAVFCVDEKTAIRAVDRLDPVLPLSPGRAERHGLEYYRDGTLSRYAALDTKTGKAVGKLPAATPARSSSPSSARCWSSVQPGSKSTSCWITSPHLKPKPVGTFSQITPRCNCTFTPTYSSWLNQVEIWFAKIDRGVIARGVFPSVKDLARKLRRYINAYSANAKPIRWKYSDFSNRIRTNVLSATGHY